MCVAALAWDAHPRWKLVAIGNRDEFHEREAAPLGEWDDGSGILAGRDLRAGGTWLGVNPAGRFVLVTNLRGYGTPDPAMASRGSLVRDLLAGDGAYADPATVPLAAFNPFNLLVANGDGLHFLTNRPHPLRTALSPGLYGLSNGELDEPWPKTLRLKSALLGWLTGAARDTAALFAPLADTSPAEAGVPPAQPSEIADEAAQTPVFIRSPVYGTRCSTVVAVDRDGRGTIAERRFDAVGNATGETRLAFSWPCRS